MIFDFTDDTLYTFLSSNVLFGYFSSFLFLKLLQLAFDDREVIVYIIILAVRADNSHSFNRCILLFQFGQFGEELELGQAGTILELVVCIHKLAVNFKKYY